MIPLLVPFHPSKMTVLRRNMRNNQTGDGNSSLYSASNADDDASEDEGFNEQPHKIINR